MQILSGNRLEFIATLVRTWPEFVGTGTLIVESGNPSGPGGSVSLNLGYEMSSSTWRSSRDLQGALPDGCRYQLYSPSTGPTLVGAGPVFGVMPEWPCFIVRAITDRPRGRRIVVDLDLEWSPELDGPP
jgi:hypothetical protein